MLCRVTRGDAGPRLGTLSGHPRILRLVDLADEPLACRASGSQEGVSVNYKHPQRVEGLSDLRWHRDCGMGGHAVMCPVLIASAFLTPATSETGELRMLPSSWKASYPYLEPGHPRAPVGARFAALTRRGRRTRSGPVAHAVRCDAEPRATWSSRAFTSAPRGQLLGSAPLRILAG